MRLLLVVPAFAVFTLSLIPVQWLALKFGWSLQRRLPGFYHRIVCRIVGINISK